MLEERSRIGGMVFTEGYGDDGPGWVAIHRTADEGFCDGSCGGAQIWVESGVHVVVMMMVMMMNECTQGCGFQGVFIDFQDRDVKSRKRSTPRTSKFREMSCSVGFALHFAL